MKQLGNPPVLQLVTDDVDVTDAHPAGEGEDRTVGRPAELSILIEAKMRIRKGPRALWALPTLLVLATGCRDGGDSTAPSMAPRDLTSASVAGPPGAMTSAIVEVTESDLPGSPFESPRSAPAGLSLHVALEAAAGSCVTLPGDVYERLEALLVARGHTVSQVSGSDIDTPAEIDTYDVLVFGAGAFSCPWDWTVFDAQVRSFVERGGGLVVSGWTAYYMAFNPIGESYPGLESSLPVNKGTSYAVGGTVAVVPGHEITDGLSDFPNPDYDNFGAGVPVGATTLLKHNGTTPAGAAWSLGAGRSVYLGPTYLANWSGYNNEALLDGSMPDAQELFLRAIEWAAALPADDTPPVITRNVNGTIGDGGWYVSDVDLSWTVTDDESPITSTSGCSVSNVTSDTNGVTFTCTATSSGGTASVSLTVKRDATNPTVTYAGNDGSYDVSDNVAITCTAADALSGLASNTCADVSGPAWSFGLGISSFSATASDHAGNVGGGSTSFEVTVSLDGLAALIQSFVSNEGVANSMGAKITAAERADARGQTRARDGSLSAFINEVEAQTGKGVDADEAAVLIAIATALMS